MTDEEYIYKPEELLFHISLPIEEEDIEALVLITPIKDWEENGYLSDEIGGHNISPDVLTICGVCEAELMESTFEILEGFTIAEVRANLLINGFKESNSFSKFLTDNQDE